MAAEVVLAQRGRLLHALRSGWFGRFRAASDGLERSRRALAVERFVPRHVAT